MRAHAIRTLGRIGNRLRSESGIGLIEMVMAMTVLTIAISAQLAVFSSAFTSIHRAGMKGTALTLADKQMEVYRTIAYTCIYLTSSAGDSTYTGDSAYSASQVTASGCNPNATPPSTATTTSQTVSGPDKRTYRVDTYIVSQTPSGGRSVKQVTVVVRRVDVGVAGSVLAREATTFDQSGSPTV